MPNKSTKQLKEYVKILEDKNAKDIVSLDMSGLSFMLDYFLICTGTSDRHLNGISRELQKAYKSHNKKNPLASAVEGSGWALVDCGEVVVHIFKKEERDLYDLESLWETAKKKKY